MKSGRITVILAVLFANVPKSLCSLDTDDAYVTVSALDEPSVNTHQTISLEDVEGLTQELVSKALLDAEEDVLREDRRIRRKREGRRPRCTYQEAHYRTRYNPALEPARKRSLILERTARKLADALGWVNPL